MVGGINGYGNQVVSLLGNTKGTKETAAEKPVWDGKKSYTYLEDMNQAGLDYGVKATKYYASKTAADGEMTVDDLKKQIGEWFSDYTLTDREPRDVVQGKHYLYIDDSQLNKMAKDSSYRAKVYGLMDREMATGKEYTLRYSDGKDVTAHITGSIFSLSEKNKKYAGPDGIPYLGSGSSDHSWSSSDSHLQVRNMSFLYDHLDPAKSARKSRTNAAKTQAEQLAKKRTEKKQEAKMAEKKKTEKAEKERIENNRENKRSEAEERLQKLLEKKETESKDGSYSLDAEDMKPILEAIREDDKNVNQPAGQTIDIRA